MSRAETPKSHRQVLDIVTSTLQQLHPNAPQPFFDDLETIVPAMVEEFKNPNPDAMSVEVSDFPKESWVREICGDVMDF